MYENELANLTVNVSNPPWPHARIHGSQQSAPASALRHTHTPSFTSAMLFFTVLLNFLCCHGYRHSGLNISRQFAFVKGSVYSGFQLRLCATPSTSSAAQLFRQTHTHTDIVHLVLKDTSQIPTQVRSFYVPSNTFKCDLTALCCSVWCYLYRRPEEACFVSVLFVDFCYVYLPKQSHKLLVKSVNRYYIYSS